MSNLKVDKFLQIKTIDSLSQDEIDSGMTEIAIRDAFARNHNFQSVFGENPIEQNDPCLLLITDENYIPPTTVQLQSVVDLLMSRGLKKTHISKNLGINPDGSRSLNYWLNPDKDRPIPYASWRLLLAISGLSATTILLNEDVKQRITDKVIRERKNKSEALKGVK